jgi:hypothetical protein
LKPTESLIDEIARENDAADVEKIRAQLDVAYEKITKKFFECLDASNFYAVLKQFVLSIGIGTGCLLVNDVKPGRQSGSASPFEFIYVPVSNLSLDTGSNGGIYGVFRDMTVRREEIPLLWHDGSAADLGDGDSFQLVECCVYDPRSEKDELPWAFCVFDCRSEVKVVLDRRLQYNPYVVFRWSTIEGESMGRGPLLEAMADIHSLNKLWATYFEWIQRNGLGITLMRSSELAYGDEERFKNYDFSTGSLLTVHDPNNFVPLRISGDLSSQQFLIAELTQAVRQQLLDIELPSENTMTAYETQQRANRILRLMAGLIGRVNMDFVTPFFKIGLRLMQKYGIIQIPERVGDINQFTTKIVLQSPLARSQQLADVEATRVALETLNLIQSPVAVQHVNMERFVEFAWIASGAPAKLLNTSEETQAVQQRAMQQQLELEQAKHGKMEQESA